MHQRKVSFSGRLAGIALAPPRADVAAPSAPEPPAAPPPEPPAVPPPPAAEIVLMRNTIAALQGLIEKLNAQRTVTIAEVAQTAVELGTALAERLMHNEIAANQQRLDRIVRAALERMQPTPAITIRGHADDLALLERQMQEHAELEPYSKVLTLRAENRYERGQLRLDSDDWFIDWDTRRALAELHDALLEETFAEK